MFLPVTVGILLYTNQHGLIFLASEMPTKFGPSVSSVVCPADKDNSHWDQTAEKVFRTRRATSVALLREAFAQKARCEASRIVGTMYAASGLQTSPEH